jgi:hypothetical protein
MSIESIVNQALDRIGYKRHIGNIWDGSAAARVALDCWGDTRDTLFTMLKPEWAIWDDELTWSKAAPAWYDDVNPWTSAYPDLPWRYEYPLPDLCLVPLALKPRPAYLPVWRPRPLRFRAKTAAGVYTLLGDEAAPILTSVHSVHDPSLWDNPFIEAVVETLAKKFARSLAPGAVQSEQQQGGQHADHPG